MDAVKWFVRTRQQKICGLECASDVHHPMDLTAVSGVSREPLQATPKPCLRWVDGRWNLRLLVDVGMMQRNESTSANPTNVNAVRVDPEWIPKCR